jgi:hypothetical protein
MSDPTFDGYACHGHMRLLMVAELGGTGTDRAAFICDECGIWRHARSRADKLRDWIERRMADYLATRDWFVRS